MTGRGARIGTIVIGGLLVAHVALGIGRLPGKAWTRRLDEIAHYRSEGAARFLLGSAKLEGAGAIEWIQHNVAADAVVLWRWPADGALELCAALLAPRLVVDGRCVDAAAVSYADRPLAYGTIPGGETGFIVLQGTEAKGLRLLVWER